MKTKNYFQKNHPAWIVLFLFQFFGCFATQYSERIQNHPFALRPEEVAELTLMGNESNSGNPWLATLTRKTKKWELDSVSSTSSLADHQTNETLIMHLLDTVSSIQIAERGPPIPLKALGLAPPQFALRWRTLKGTQEIKVGTPSKDQSHVNITWDNKTAWLASGTFFTILSQIQSWQSLRAPTWVTESPDDIEEITIKTPKKTLFYAQRDGDRWDDASHHLIRIDVDQALDSLLQHPWKSLIDLSTELIPLQKIIQERPDYSITLSGRMKNQVRLKIKNHNGILYALNLNRTGCLFILDESQVHFLRKFQ